VYVRRGGSGPPLTPPYTGPFLVVERGRKVFKVQVGEEVETISVDRLKPHTGVGSFQPAVPPKRGRPPKRVASSSPVVQDASAEGGPVENIICI